jgi:hypothetical protein
MSTELQPEGDRPSVRSRLDAGAGTLRGRLTAGTATARERLDAGTATARERLDAGTATVRRRAETLRARWDAMDDDPPLRHAVGHRPSIGAAAAAKAVAEDASALVRAEVALAKAELQHAAKEKATAAGLLAGAGVLGWLALQGVLITIAFGLAAAGLPGWAAAGIVTLVLLIGAGILALLGKKRLARKVGLDTTKQNVEEDVAWTKAHLPTRKPESRAS